MSVQLIISEKLIVHSRFFKYCRTETISFNFQVPLNHFNSIALIIFSENFKINFTDSKAIILASHTKK